MKFNIPLPVLEETPSAETVKICAHCKSTNTIKHTSVETRIIRDTKVRFIQRMRRYCKDCERTYTVHPQGIEKGYQRSRRLIFSCMLMYLAGLSYDKASRFLSVLFQIKVGAKSTLWNDIQRLGDKLEMQGVFTRVRLTNQPTIIGADGTGIKIKGRDFSVEFVVDHSPDTPEEQSLLGISISASENSQTIYNLIQTLAQELDLSKVGTLVSDDGAANHKAADMINGLDFQEKFNNCKAKIVPRLNHLQVKHQVCLAHVKKNAVVRLDKLKNKTPPDILEKLREVVENDFHPDHLPAIETMVSDQRVHRVKELHQFLFSELWAKYHKYSLFWKDDAVPSTNNRAERTIGRSKIRYQLCRGLKSIDGARNFLLATQVFEAKRFDQMLAAVVG